MRTEESASAIEFLPSGDTALVVQLGDRVSRDLNQRVQTLQRRLEQASLPGVIETVPTFRSVMVHYDPLQTAFEPLREQIEGLAGDWQAATADVRVFVVPVCYEPRFAPDLDEVGRLTGLDVDSVVAAHCGARYHVYMLGFVPGFPYLGDLPPSLELPRRVEPRVRIPSGSVAIATTLTAIYPVESPGGWHLIGRTPIRLFDPGDEPPALFSPGDRVEFEPVDAREFARIEAAVEHGDYRPSLREPPIPVPCSQS